jgi:hypothetical protein
LRRDRLAPLLFVALAVVFTWPLILYPASRLGALAGPGDPYLNLWILGWDLQTISESPLKLVTGGVFDANIFYPARQTLTYSDHFLLQALATWPIYFVTHNPVLCYNVVLFGSLVASAWAMYGFVRRVTGSTAGATVAGVIWGFWPFHFAHLEHLQLQALYFLPLAFLFLFKVIAGARWRDGVGLGAMAGLQAVASVYWGVIGAIALALAGLTAFFAAGRRGGGKLAARAIAAALVAFVVVLPILWPYVQAQEREGFGRNLYEASQHAASFDSYFTAPPVNWLRGDSQKAGPESQLFTGFTVLVLAAFGALAARRSGYWPLGAAALALILAGVVLSLGPAGIRPLYAFLQYSVFGFQAIRAPARFAAMATFGLALLAAIATTELQRRQQRRVGVASTWRQMTPIAIVALLVLEFANRPLPYVAAPPLTTPTGQWLKQADHAGAVLYVPLTLDIENTPFMVESLEHRRPIVNGYSGLRPSFYPALVETLQAFPSAEAMWTLKDLNVRYVISPTPVAEGLWPLVERARFEPTPTETRRVIYEVVWNADIEARLSDPSVPVPPPHGPIPFAPGESLVYRVDWAGPAGSVAAGTIEVRVESPPTDAASQPSAAYRFVLNARTAPWISRFYEADDRFITEATAELMPIRHERRLREGRRSVDEAVRFDDSRHLVLPEGTGGRPPLRLWPGARDPLTAFFYLRTLPLAPGVRLQIPVNDNGRNLILDVRVDGVERIHAGRGEQETLRVTPVLRERLERRPPLEMTVWLSQDAQRVPLAADVRAVFGALHLELQ